MDEFIDSQKPKLRDQHPKQTIANEEIKAVQPFHKKIPGFSAEFFKDLQLILLKLFFKNRN